MAGPHIAVGRLHPRRDLQGADAREVALREDAVASVGRDQCMREPEVHGSLVVLDGVRPGVACMPQSLSILGLRPA